jgi:hypothetical protein
MILVAHILHGLLSRLGMLVIILFLIIINLISVNLGYALVTSCS